MADELRLASRAFERHHRGARDLCGDVRSAIAPNHIASGDYIIYGDFSASPSSFLRYATLELDLIDDAQGSTTTADPDLAIVASHGLAYALGDEPQLQQWIVHGGWYVRVNGVDGDVRLSTTAYTTHDNKMLEHSIEGAGGTIVHEGHQVLYYR